MMSIVDLYGQCISIEEIGFVSAESVDNYSEQDSQGIYGCQRYWLTYLH